MNSKAILITGGDGYIGKQLAKQYLDNTSKNVILWIRAENQSEYVKKEQSLKKEFAPYINRIKVVSGDLRDDSPFEQIDSNNINTIIHTAAITRFNVESDLANQVNRDGTRKVLAFANQCTDLEHYAQISTVYTSGLAAGEISEEPVDIKGPFANHYERSKCEAEHILLTEYSHLPWHIYRIATIIADNDEGHVIQYNVVHNTIRLLFHGLISILPGLRETPVYLVTGQFVSQAIYHLCNQKYSDKKIFNVCHSKQESISLGDFIDALFVKFSNNTEFQKRRILKPLFTDLNAFESLATALDGLGSLVVRQALQSMRPFVKQLYITKDIDNSDFRSAYTHYKSPEIDRLIDNVVDHLITTQWGNQAK